MTSTPSTIIPMSVPYKKDGPEVFFGLPAMLLGNMPHLVFNDQSVLCFVIELLRYFLAVIAT